MKTSHKLPRTIKQSEIVGSGKNRTTPLCSETTKREKIFDEKNAKATRQSHAYNDYANT